MENKTVEGLVEYRIAKLKKEIESWQLRGLTMGDIHSLGKNPIAELSKEIEDLRKSLKKSRNTETTKLEIRHSDIATVEALHDLLIDAHGYSLDFHTLKKARELTSKMYQAFKDNKRKVCNHSDENWIYDESGVDMYCKECYELEENNGNNNHKNNSR